MPNNIKLTHYSSGAGWACKLGPEDLNEALSGIKKNFYGSNNTSGFESFDDCAIYHLDNKIIIQSLDFFTPIVDDPYTFGQIAAANSLSDIYAMGGKPLFSLNIAGFPADDLPISILTEILNGGQSIAEQAKIPILGGHTVKDKEPKYGMAVTGCVEKQNIVKNNTAKEGDLLVLTKPLGIGIISTGIKKGVVNQETYNDAVKTMVHLNHGAQEAMNLSNAHACTDVTGYGLLGHLMEMCIGSDLSAEIHYKDIPFIHSTDQLAKSSIVPGGSQKNLSYVSKKVEFSNYIQEYQQLMIADAQTSGGLLISISEKNVTQLINELKNQGCLSYNIIGTLKQKNKKTIYVV